MDHKSTIFLWGAFFLVTHMALSRPCEAKSQAQQTNTAAGEQKANADSNSKAPDGTHAKDDAQNDPDGVDNNSLGLQFLKNLATDQKAIWTSPSHLHWADATWLFPLAGVVTGAFYTDTAAARGLSNNPVRLKHYQDFSNYGLGAMVGVGAGAYILGRISHDEHKRETGVLAAEAIADSLAINTALEYSLGREGPQQDNGRGRFFQGGTSFPSDHAITAWSAASVYAHEYPGALSQILAYGLASAVSISRVTGKEHFPSDVIIGSAAGWLIGREVYKRHHDPELGAQLRKIFQEWMMMKNI